MIKNKLYLYSDYKANVPAHLHAGQYILDKLWSNRNRNAIINAETGETLSRKELAQESINVALSLGRIGVEKGHVVGICSEKRKEFLPTLLGIICTGATFSPADVTCGRATILHRINIAKMSVMFCSPSAYIKHKETLLKVENIKKIIVYSEESDENSITYRDFLTEQGSYEEFIAKPVNGREDIAVILYSSGTTGLPKGIPLTHLNFIIFTTFGVNDDRFYDGTTALNTREWYYTYGMAFTLSCLNAGGTIIYSSGNEEQDSLEAIQKYKINVLQLAPASVTEFVKSTIIQNYDVSSVQRIITASTTCGAELVAAAAKRFPNLEDIHQIYGLSEMGCAACTERSPLGSRFGSVGHVNAELIIKVVDLTTREPLGPNQRGEICIMSLAFTPSYLGETEHDYLDEEGYFKTGDIGYYDDDKYIFIVDRIKELIKFDSFQVAPAELEAVLLQYEGVRDAGVVGAPHPKYGQAPTAFVVLQSGVSITEEELVAYVDSEVSHRMRLAGGVRFVKELPRSAGAKLDRKALKLML